MKGEEYVVEDKKDHQHPISMFSKFQQHPHPHHHHNQNHNHNHSQPLHPSAHHHYQLTTCQTSEEADSRSRSPTHVTTPSTATNNRKLQPSSNDGASIEVVRRPRGRPPGSKNKPKPPIIITRDSEPSMSPYVLELPGGADLIESITRFCRKRNTGLCVLTGSGTVANVTLRQPSTTPGSTVTFHGRFDILSVSATVLPSIMTPSSATAPFANGFTISLAGPQGQIVGGAVVGPLLAAGTVYIIGASFNNPLFHRLPAEDDIVRTSNSGGGGGDGGNEESPPAVSGGGDSGRHGLGTAAGGGESCGTMSIYSCNLASDVIWAPAARQAPPPPPY